MKSVITAAVLLVITVGFTVFVTVRSNVMINDLYTMTEALPAAVSDYSGEEREWKDCVKAIGETWAEDVRYFSYVCGYTALNRADEAVWDLYAAILSGSYAEAIRARMQLLDALARMRELEDVSLSSVF